MTWNNRIFYNPETKGFGVHEAFYEDGKVTAWTENPIDLGNYCSLDELKASVAQISKDVAKLEESDVLDYNMQPAVVEKEEVEEVGAFEFIFQLFGFEYWKWCDRFVNFYIGRVRTGDGFYSHSLLSIEWNSSGGWSFDFLYLSVLKRIFK